jgi:hypothetical protein
MRPSPFATHTCGWFLEVEAKCLSVQLTPTPSDPSGGPSDRQSPEATGRPGPREGHTAAVCATHISILCKYVSKVSPVLHVGCLVPSLLLLAAALRSTQRVGAAPQQLSSPGWMCPSGLPEPERHPVNIRPAGLSYRVPTIRVDRPAQEGSARKQCDQTDSSTTNPLLTRLSG